MAHESHNPTSPVQ